MQNNTARELSNRNQSGPAQAGSQPVTGCKSVGHPAQHPSRLGAGTTRSARSCIENSPADSRQRGGQHSLDLFGVPSVTGRPRQHTSAAQGEAPTAAQALANARRFPQTRVKGALSPYGTDGLSPAHFGEPDLTGLHSSPIGDKTPAAHALTIRVPITRERLYVFAALATVEQRPVADVVGECLADMAAHLCRTRQALILDEHDTAGLNAYLDSVEAMEIEREEEEARAATTPAMRHAAHAADMREAFPHVTDDEEADFAHRCAGAGYVEITLSMEGN